MEKKIYEIWHLADERERPMREGGTKAYFPEDYDLVARVEARNPNEAYWMTCHNKDLVEHVREHHPDGLAFITPYNEFGKWWDQEGVECIKASNRSTTVNDVLVDPDGNVYLSGLEEWLLVFQRDGHTSDGQRVNVKHTSEPEMEH